MTEQLKPLTEAETTELLDWVSACQSSYHIDSTPGHRFGGLGSQLQENRDALVEYVDALIAARAQPAQAGQVLTDEEVQSCIPTVALKGQDPVTMAWLKQADAIKAIPLEQSMFIDRKSTRLNSSHH